MFLWWSSTNYTGILLVFCHEYCHFFFPIIKCICTIVLVLELLHWARDKIAAICEDGILHAFPWMRIFAFWSKIPLFHDDVIKWKHFRVAGHLCWEFTGDRWIPLTLEGQWRGALTFSMMCAWTNGWVNNRDADDLTRHRAHYDVIVMNNQALAQIPVRRRTGGRTLSEPMMA